MRIGRKTVAGFQWDTGNREKCEKHGVSIREIEDVFVRILTIEADSFGHEERLRAIGTTSIGRFVFVVFTLRVCDQTLLIRPITARYMHQREIRTYEEEKDSEVQD